jgi:hypothetical protein
MRFDNPITDHGFKFPDIAQYSDVKSEWRMEEDLDCSELYTHYENNDWPAFEAKLGELFTHSIRDLGKLDIENEEDLKLFEQINITQMEMDEGKQWVEKLQHFFNLYQSFSKNSNKID